MAKEIESINSFERQSHEYGLKKDVTVIRCDDGSIYEFVQAEDEPVGRLAQRFDSSGEMSLSRGVLPSAVKQTARDLFGRGRWTK